MLLTLAIRRVSSPANPGCALRRRAAVWELGWLLVRNGEVERGEQLLVKAAQDGNKDAALHLGMVSFATNRVPEAKRWLRVAADGGHASAAYLLSITHRKGQEDEEA